MKESIRIGKIINTHGLQGEVKVYPYTDDPKRFKEIGEVRIEGNEAYVKIEQAKQTAGLVVLRLQGVGSIEQAQALKNRYLFIRPEQRRPLPKDTYQVTDLIGLEAVDSTGQRIGQIEDVWVQSAQDILEINTGATSFLVPFVKRFVPIVDLEKALVVLDLIEGMQE